MSESDKETIEIEQAPDEEIAEENADAEQDTEASLEQKLTAAKEEAAKNYDLAVRAQAEMENLRRRTLKDVENAHKYALENFAKELLNVADSIDLGLNAAEDNASVESLKEGMQLSRKQFYSVLEKFNIEAVDAEGAKFDPELHEAITMLPNPETEPNTVLEVVQKGYTLNNRLLRAAKVVVSSA